MVALRGIKRAAVASGTAVTVFYGVASVSGNPPRLTGESAKHLLGDALFLWTEKSKQVGQAAASIFGTLKDTALEVLHGRTSSSDNLTQSFVSRVEEWSGHPTRSKTLVVLGGQFLLDWLLRKADGPTSPDQVAAENAVCNLLSNDVTAAALLHLEGGVHRLLCLLTHSEHPERLAGLLSNAAATVSLPAKISLDDLRGVIAMVNGPHEALLRSVGVQLLARLAEASVLNCGKMASMHAGAALVQALATAGRGTDDSALCTHATHAMAVLARDCPLRSLLEMGTWIQQLLFLAADAAADRNDRLVVRALDALSTCLIHGNDMEDAVQKSNAWALLHKLAAGAESDVRRAITLAVTALAKHHLPDKQQQYWGPLLLAWLCAGMEQKGMAEAAEAHHIALALSALAHTPGRRGLSLASVWLGDILVALSRNVKTYSSIRVGGRDMVEEVTQDHVPVAPAFARSVAHDLRDAYDRPFTFQDPPIDMEQTVRPSTINPQPDLISPEDAALADAQLCRALKILCALVSSDDSKQRWLQSAGIVSLLQRLALEVHNDFQGSEGSYGSSERAMSMGSRRQCARLLAMIAGSGNAQALRQSGEWLQWLKRSAASEDCKLSSHATRALLHLQSAETFQLPVSQAVEWEKLPGEGLEHNTSSQTVAYSEAAPSRRDPNKRLILKDGIHLFCPTAEHHSILAREGTGSTSKGAPLVDVVFVHGIRGGPFASWRAGLGLGGRVSESLTHNFCWPSEWLGRDMPAARLLSLEYAAPASGWEGESLPLRGTVGQLVDKLAAAGVGDRPCIFVCHSMGGILTKELIAKASAKDAAPHQQRLADSTAGLVFFACPHSGSWLAEIGWTLRFVGASPAASVLHLKPGKHLEEVNEVIAQLHAERGMAVLSFCEGAPTSVMMSLPQLVVVPEASAYPGYGRFVVLRDVDHINACKPILREDASYAETLEFVRGIVETVKSDTAGERAANIQDTEICGC